MAALDGDVDIVIRDDAREALRDAAELDGRGGVRVGRR